MKIKVLSLLLMLALLAGCAALAEAPVEAPAADPEAPAAEQIEAETVRLGAMKVVNVGGSVNLRGGPGTEFDVVASVPLGGEVTDCVWDGGDFIACTYGEQSGYIHRKYLMPDPSVHVDIVLDEKLSSIRLLAERFYDEDGERLLVMCLNRSAALDWACETVSGFWELEGTSAFLAGTTKRPMMMVYNVNEGLRALDRATGEELWRLTPDQAELGGSISTAVGKDGTMYIGGYYGPDPVAIDIDGNVLWRASADGDAYYISDIELRKDGVAAYYAGLDGGDNSGWIVYGLEDGALLNTEYD